MSHAWTFARWKGAVGQNLLECLGIAALCHIVVEYAREFGGELLHTVPRATDSGCLLRALPDNRVIVVDQCELHVWQATSGVHLLSLEGHTDHVSDVCVTTSPLSMPRSSYIASCSRDRTARVWDGDSGACLHCLVHPKWVISVIFLTPPELVTCCHDNHVRIWHNGVCLRTILNLDVSVLVPLSSAKFASCGFDDVMHIWDRQGHFGTQIASDEVVVLQLVACTAPADTLCSHDGTRIYIWSDHRCTRTIECGVMVLCALPDGLLAGGLMDGTVRVWDVRTGACVWTFCGHTGIVWTLTDMPDNKFASGSVDCAVRVWDLTTGKCAFVLHGPPHVKGLLALDQTLVALNVDCTMSVWS